ncbi:MAG: hypothetical protein PHY92_01660 [Alphaproteobacteria bacterium]|nr:hypothetical protein [Alphaproteobacteria bacterium]
MLSIFNLNGKGKLWFLAPVFVGLLLMGVAGNPAPAHAGCCPPDTTALTSIDTTQKASWIQQAKDWLQSFALLKQIIDVVTWINDGIKDLTKQWKSDVDTLIGTVHIDNMLSAQQTMLSTQSQNSVTVATAENTIITKIAADRFIMPKARRIDCDHVIMSQSAMANSHYFDKQVSLMYQAWLRDMPLGKEKDAAGPYEIGRRYALKCPPKGSFIPENWPRDTNPLNESKDPNCEDSSGKFAKLTFGNILADANLEIPDMTADGMVMPSNFEQGKSLWAALLVYQAQGFPPTDMVGAARQAPGGKNFSVKRAVAEGARQGLAAVCFDFIAAATRPDCLKYPDKYKAECDASEKACKLANIAGIDVEPYNCTHGLSTIMAERLSGMACATPKAVESMLHAGGSLEGSTALVEACRGIWAASVSKANTMQANCADALAKMQTLQWPTGGASPTIKSIKAPGATETMEKHEAEEASAIQEQPETPKAKKVRARTKEVNRSPETAPPPPVKMKNGLPLGVPVSADEISWPKAVEQ